MFAEVIVDVQNSEVDRVFDYAIPSDIKITAGDRVIVPFASRNIEGYVIGIKEVSQVSPEKLKSVIKKLDQFSYLTPEMLEVMHFMKQKYFVSYTSCIRLFIPSQIRGGKVKILKEEILKFLENNYEEVLKSISKKATKQLEVLNYLKTNKQVKISQLNKLFGNAPVKKIIGSTAVEIITEEKLRSPMYEKLKKKNIIHSFEQKRAINSINLNTNKKYLLHGVTGSGKTEVYMSVIKKVLEMGKTAIMLVPEISLTPQVLSNFKLNFGEDVALLHSGLSAGERFDEWRKLLLGEARIAVGARSAVFAPLKNLGLIIIDEEHDQSYLSESNPRYNTEDIAIFRSNYNNCPLILGSATPSIVSYYKTKINDWELIELPIRINRKPLPKIRIVDMLSEVKSGGNLIFSSPLLRGLEECIHNKKQAMLFINRRGFSSFLMCRECGYVAKCTDCDVSLVYHREENVLKCHYCGKRYKGLNSCPDCKSTYIKQGAVGTEKVVFELQKMFPNVKVLRMDNDTTRNKNSHMKILKEFAETRPSILVGTQMIAKGHDFSDVTLVGILDADQSLFHSDFKSSERTFQLITQVSGRAGRSEDEGMVILQTFCPKHYVYKFVANYNYRGFFDKEINIRETTNFPPYSSIVRILFTSMKEELVVENIKLCYNRLLEVKKEFENEFLYLDIMKSPLKRLQNKFRYQILMRLKPQMSEIILKKIYELISDFKQTKFWITVELNPQNLV